jgi:hypothetical protein
MTFLYVIALGTANDLVTEAQDVVTAYLYGRLEHEVYMDAPIKSKYTGKTTDIPNRPVVKLQRALYGLKQAGRMWFQELTNYLRGKGFKSEEGAPCLHLNKEKDGFVIVTIYVDDLVIVGTRKSVNKFKAEISEKFEMKDLGALSHCIGLQISKTERGTFVSQSTYTRELLRKYGMD